VHDEHARWLTGWGGKGGVCGGGETRTSSPLACLSTLWRAPFFGRSDCGPRPLRGMGARLARAACRTHTYRDVPAVTTCVLRAGTSTRRLPRQPHPDAGSTRTCGRTERYRDVVSSSIHRNRQLGRSKRCQLSRASDSTFSCGLRRTSQWLGRNARGMRADRCLDPRTWSHAPVARAPVQSAKTPAVACLRTSTWTGACTHGSGTNLRPLVCVVAIPASRTGGCLTEGAMSKSLNAFRAAARVE
jgi:hypothetical protein